MPTLLTHPRSLTVIWGRCQGNVWCDLEALNLDHPYFRGLEGVYVIWSSDGHWVRVGQGAIADRLKVQRLDPNILRHRGTGTLRATWAKVSAPYRDGVERYLLMTLRPLETGMYPAAAPIQVNIPQ
jgi:hypothetical protein